MLFSQKSLECHDFFAYPFIAIWIFLDGVFQQTQAEHNTDYH